MSDAPPNPVPFGQKLAFGLGPGTAHPALAQRLQDTRDGDLVEHCPAATPTMTALAARIAAHGGAALIVDYGDWRSLGDTLQALKAHEPTGVLDGRRQSALFHDK